MTADEYREALEVVGLTQGQAARFFNAGNRNARRWASGEQDIPPTVIMLLRLMVHFGVTADQVDNIVGELDD